MIGRSGERRSGISVLAARHDDDYYLYLIRSCLFVSFKNEQLARLNDTVERKILLF